MTCLNNTEELQPTTTTTHYIAQNKTPTTTKQGER